MSVRFTPLALLVALAPTTVVLADVPAIVLETAVEENEPILLATVNADGVPVEDAAVRFEVERTFGWIRLGEEVTLDDGTAAVPFPVGLPAGGSGLLRVRARLIAPAALAGRETTAELEPMAMRRDAREEFAVGVPLHRRVLQRALGERFVRLEVDGRLEGKEPGRRALWAARAPLGLIATFILLLGGVWLTYARVLVHLYRIRRGGRS